MQMRVWMKKGIKKLNHWFYIYRYDLFAMTLMSLAILYYVSVLFQPGHIVFSDIAFPFNSETYMDEVVGLWNTRWNTVSMLNIPRLFFILPLYLVSGVFGWNGHLFLKGFIIELLFLSAFSMYLFTKRLVSVYMGSSFNLWKIMALVFGGVLYALNPWVIYRIQHIYLLTGYSIFPLVILYFFKVFDQKFQRQIIHDYNPYSKKIYSRNIVDAIILAYLITLASAAIHYFFYTILVLGGLFILICTKYFVGNIKKGKIVLSHIFLALSKKAILVGVLLGGMSFYWLSIYLGGIIFDVGASQHNINVIDTYTMFSRHASLDQVLLMLGYWWPMINLNDLPLSFYISGACILGVMGLGVIFTAYKHHIVLFLSIVAGGLILVSTGVYYPAISSVFLKLAGLPAFGNIFRDPNKMIGITAISYSVLFVFGMEKIYSWTENLKTKKYINTLVFAAVALACFFYLMPIRTLYFDRFYEPIEEPQAYKDLRHYYKDEGVNEEPYVLYVPLAEQMLRPVVHIATPKWNVPEDESNVKATGDIHIYNSPVRTLFHHEGNDPSIKYMYDVIQFLLDQGRTTEMAKLSSVFGVNQFIYHNEYLDQEIRQNFNEEILAVQDDLEKVYVNDIFTIFDLPLLEDRHFNHRRLFSPYGMSKMITLTSMNEYNPLELPVVYMAKEKIFNDGVIQSDDVIEMRYLKDLILSNVPEQYRLYPFDYVHEVNPFIKWSKTYTTFFDWAWIQSKLGVIHPKFEWDHDSGMVMTFASEAFDVQPHEKKLLKGEIVYDFDSLLKADQFFVADNPDLFEVISNPYNLQEDIGVLQGVIQQGEPSFIWQVAKSPILIAEEKMPYQFKILVSGRGANKLHMKARFYDKNKNEIGIQYIVGPDEFVDFDTVEFTGEVVSPKDSAFFRIDLLTYQRPENKVFWWIHDVEIKKFPEYTSANIVDMTHKVTPGWHRIFVKSFESIRGGDLDIQINSETVNVNTQTTQLSGFKWIDLGRFKLEDQVQVHLENLTGFNAVQHLVIIPESAFKDLESKWTQIVSEHDRILLLETEMDFNKSGNIQSRRLYPELSYGTGTALSSGHIDADFEIVMPGAYKIEPKVYYPDLKAGQVTIKLVGEDGEPLMEKALKVRQPVDVDETLTIDFEPLGTIYPYRPIDINRPYKFVNQSLNDTVLLKKGNYKLIIDIESENKNYAGLKTFHTFDPNSIVTETVLRDKAIFDCSTCEIITPDMMRHTYIDENTMKIEFDPTCSCDWYISSSDPIQVEALEELLISFEAKSDAIEKRHSKLVFLDAYKQVIDTAFIFEVEEEEKSDWNVYEQLVRVPEGAEEVLYQFWARGHKTRMGQLEIKNFKLEKYKELILADRVHIYSENLSFNVDDLNPQLIKHDTSEMQIKVQVLGETNKKTVWNSFMSPHKIWRVDGQPSPLTLNGVTMGFEAHKESVDGEMLLGKIYLSGIVLHFITLILGVSGYVYMKRRGQR